MLIAELSLCLTSSLATRSNLEAAPDRLQVRVFRPAMSDDALPAHAGSGGQEV